MEVNMPTARPTAPLAATSVAGAFALLATLPIALGVLSGAHAQIAFTDVSATAGVNYSGESYGASWVDLNGDGYPDIFACNTMNSEACTSTWATARSLKRGRRS